VRWLTALWCEPSFFAKRALGLANTAKNEGWQSALIFCYFFIKEKVRTIKAKPAQ
jgi:hypothetical protein